MQTKLAYIFYKHLFENYETDKVFKLNNAVKSYIDALQTDKPGIHLIASPRQQGGTTDIIINALHDIYAKGLKSVQIIVWNELEAKDIINKLKNYIYKNDILSEDEDITITWDQIIFGDGSIIHVDHFKSFDSIFRCCMVGRNKVDVMYIDNAAYYAKEGEVGINQLLYYFNFNAKKTFLISTPKKDSVFNQIFLESKIIASRTQIEQINKTVVGYYAQSGLSETTIQQEYFGKVL